MLTTAHARHDERFRLLRQHGMSVPDTVRHASTTVIAESYPTVGFNYRMTDIQAAIGREQLKRLPAIVARRRDLAQRYGDALRGVPGIALPVEPAWARSNWQTYAVRLTGADQRTVMQRMLDAGVSTRRGVMNAHREAAYPKGSWSCGPAHDPCTCPGAGCERLRNGEIAQDTAIALPLFHQMTEAQQDQVVAALRAASARSAPIVAQA
jgi:dTDP-4-amino-4,6-dideoxygalactose transaminase